MASGATQNHAGLIITRAFLGVFEAAFGAGAPYFLSLFYQRRELGKRVSFLLGMSPLANCFASSLAYGILQIDGSISSWRLLFLIGRLTFPWYILTSQLIMSVYRGCADSSVCCRRLVLPPRLP